MTSQTFRTTTGKTNHNDTQPRILILGGTTEANELAEHLSKDPTFHVTTSRAGVTVNRAKVSGNERMGGFGGVEGLIEYLRTSAINVVIDATHPFASTITGNTWTACQKFEIPHLILQRSAWCAEQNDNWIEVPDIQTAQEYLRTLENSMTVFLTTGQKKLDGFIAIKQHKFIARMIEPSVSDAEKQNLKIILQRGPFSEDEETRLVKEEKIDLIVCKNSGGTATYAKLIVARKHNIPVLMISRPPLPSAIVKSTVKGILSWLQNHFSAL
ncbi:hypothetical protein WH96_00225 [Kiloniella spongiae]|uniref:Cobalt-precorrin-6X reductase n=1 Tax=Kiloniella spongiae TaxID=1489064 RepID=A0A0H2MI29_9PROT|nr:cobalt-precorrin-6A reductase [Kiloniella spongiae]KLN62013.1 hypothetical protein WH96_00225 [Kiloniella spongiae]